MSQDPHQRILQQIVRSTLKPAGLVQKGQSRLWYDDRSWFATCVEFQPVSGRRGSFLNVGVTWLWHPKAFWSFDVGGRMGDLVEYDDEVRFRSDVAQMTDTALRRALEIRAMVASPADACTLIARDRTAEEDGWRNYHLGIAAGLSLDTETAIWHLHRSIEPDRDIDWMKQRNMHADELVQNLQREGNIRKLIDGRVVQARALLHLPTRNGPFFDGPGG